MDRRLLDLAIDDHEDSLRADIAKLGRSAIVPADLVVSGHIYDVETGALRQVVAPAALAER